MAHYPLVIHEVDTTEATVWVGSLNPHNKKPDICELNCFPAGKPNSKAIAPVAILKPMWKRPFSGMNKRFHFTCSFHGLQPGTHYTVQFRAKVLKSNGKEKWEIINSGSFDTLPLVLPAAGEKPLTIALGSCFYPHYDGGQAARSYKALYLNKTRRPEICFLTGDQVYLDINLFFPLNKEDTRDRIADRYAENWRELGGILKRGGTWMLPDDHELWNNYPVTDGPNPYIQALKYNDSFRKRWQKCAKDGIRNVQRVKPVRIFTVGSDLSFCVADLRSNRTVTSHNKPQQFTRDADLKKIIKWIKNLKCPGVFVTPQPLLDKKGSVKTDYTLANFTSQYKQLVIAVDASEHDIVVLSGDVHYGRVSKVKAGVGAGRIIEVIASPFSNLTGKDSISVSTPNSHGELKNFPAGTVVGVKSKKINRMAKVETEKEFWDFRYLIERTKEHFITLAFTLSSGGKVSMDVQAWKLRDIDNKGLPEKEYMQEINFKLR